MEKTSGLSKLSFDCLNSTIDVFVKLFNGLLEGKPVVSPNPLWKKSVLGCLTYRSDVVLGGPWSMKAAIESKPSAVSLKVLLCETIYEEFRCKSL